MESVYLRVANWDHSEVDKACYSVTLKVPPKQELLNLMPNHLGKMQYSVKFVTGILASVGHSITLCLYREGNEPRLGVFVTVGRHAEKIVEVKMIDANYVALDQANIEYSLSLATPPKGFEIPTENIGLDSEAGRPERIDFWMSTCGWHDETAMIFLTLHVVSRYPPNIVNEEEENFSRQWNANEQNGQINISNLFLEEKFSDIFVECQSQRFPAHRLVLSAQVEYFNTMLSIPMKESLEGVINMDDMDPPTCKELLRFIYQRKVDNLPKFAFDLFAAADKYGMADLKALCEHHLYTHLSHENALEIFDLSQMHGSPVLVKRAKEIIISNKDKFAHDPETFRAFTCKHPELMFQLFKMST